MTVLGLIALVLLILAILTVAYIKADGLIEDEEKDEPKTDPEFEVLRALRKIKLPTEWKIGEVAIPKEINFKVESEVLREIELKNTSYDEAVLIAEAAGYEIVKWDRKTDIYTLRLRKCAKGEGI